MELGGHLTEIAKFLESDPDLRSCSLVCKSWREGIANPMLWYNRAFLRDWAFEQNENNKNSYRSLYISEVENPYCDL